MKPLYIFVVLIAVATFASFAVLTNDFELDAQKIGVWDTVEDFDEQMEGAGFSCECAQIVNGEIATDINGDPIYSEDFCDPQGDAPGLKPHALMNCAWEVHVGVYGAGIDENYYGDGCNADFWIEHSTKNNYLWPAEYKPYYKYNDVFSTNIKLSPISENYGKSNDGLTPLQIKKNAIIQLEEIENPSPDSAKNIQAAIKFLEKSIDQDSWVDESHLVYWAGSNVFSHDSKAVNELLEILARDIDRQEIMVAVHQIIEDIVQADRILAYTPIYDLTIFAHHGDFFDLAIEEIKKAKKNFIKNHPDQSINILKLVWQLTGRAAQSHMGFYYDGTPTLLHALLAKGAENWNDKDLFASVSVAALLNSAHYEINYPYQVKEVIGHTQDTILNEEFDPSDTSSTFDSFRNMNMFGGKVCENSYPAKIIDFCPDCLIDNEG